MNIDEMKRSVEDFKKKAEAKEAELRLNHENALREILELRPEECLADAVSDLFRYIRTRASWLATWWSDIFGPKAKDRDKCYGHLGKMALVGDPKDIALYLCVDGEYVCVLDVWELEDGMRYAEHAPNILKVKFKDSKTLDFENNQSPDDVASQLKAYKNYCAESEKIFRKIYEVVKRMRTYELKKNTEKAKALSASLESL